MNNMEIIQAPRELAPFVKNLILMEDAQPGYHDIPTYADGFPGIMYSETDQVAILKPANKPLSEFFLYGQTIKPIILSIPGPYKAIVLQLYPFAAKLLLGVDPKELNDQCFDLLQIKEVDTQSTLRQLHEARHLPAQIDLINTYLKDLVKVSASNPDHRIKMAVNIILNSKGKITVKELREQLFIGERTLERHFSSEVGMTPKQFARIIQFNFSLNKLAEKDYMSLSDLSYESGFADQSHFIRTFKQFVGKTPKEFLSQLPN